jgi:hypothetical protein
MPALVNHAATVADTVAPNELARLLRHYIWRDQKGHGVQYIFYSGYF